MTAQPTLAPSPELTPLADYLAGVLNRLRPSPPLDLALADAYGHTLAQPLRARTPVPAFGRAETDGYAARWEDVVAAAPGRPVRLRVAGDLSASSWRQARLVPGTCFSVAAGAPLPAGADVVISPSVTDQAASAVEVREHPRRGQGVRRAGEEIPTGALVARAGARLGAGVVAVAAATGVQRVSVCSRPRVAVISTGDELVEPGGGGPAQRRGGTRPGQVVDVNSYALVAGAAEAGARAYRVGICPDDPQVLLGALEQQLGRAELVVTTGGTGAGPRDVLRRALVRDGSIRFTEVSLFPCTSVGFGILRSGPAQDEEVAVVCLPGDPGAALIGFEAVVRPMVRQLAGAEPVFRPSVRAHLLETVTSPAGMREFRPARVSERRGGGYTARPLQGGPYSLSGMAAATGLMVLGERVVTCPAGSTVDVLLLDRH